MYGNCLGKASHPALFNVNNPAGGHLKRLPGVAGRKDTLVQANRRRKACLKLPVIPQVIF